MARVSGPLLSLSASGTIANTLVYASWKGRPYARTHVIPTNPKTAAQVAVRSMLKFLSQYWTSEADLEKASFETLSEAANVSPFNSYVGYNQSRFRDFHGPAQTYPAAETATPGTVTLAAPSGAPRSVTLSVEPSTATDQWGYLVYRSATEITTPSWNQVVAVLPIDGTDAVVWTDSGLSAGTYHYRVALFTEDGVIGTACADQSGTAT